MKTSLKITSLTVFILFMLSMTLSGLVYASPPLAEKGTAFVDGSISDWDLTTDFFANMYRAGDADKPNPVLESKLYIKYNCVSQILFVLVLNEPGVPALVEGDEAWVKIGGSKMVDGTFGDDNSPPDFAWVYDNDVAVGFEASFIMAPGSYIDLDVHINVYDDGESQTSGTDGPIPLILPPCTFIDENPFGSIATTLAMVTGLGGYFIVKKRF